MPEEQFNGHQKTEPSILYRAERRFIDSGVKKIPGFIETYHLTLLTLVWSICLPFTYFLSQTNANWLWLSSLIIVCHYLSDAFDGALGRYRNTGLIKWGYYMDHLFYFIFLCAIMIGYSFVIPGYHLIILFFAINATYMVNSFLTFSVLDEFRLSFFKVGPTETRIFFIITNTLIYFLGTGFLFYLLPIIVSIVFLSLVLLIYKTQKDIWKKDMEIKKL